MYFIPRNNAIYNYIAHTSVQRRYIATLCILAGFAVVCFYGIYVPLSAHIIVYKAEYMRLQKQHEEVGRLDKSSKELLTLVYTSKKNITDQAIESDKKEEHCSQRMSFVLDTITRLGLTLATYGSCKEKDKVWYVKDSAHYEFAGTLEKIMSFLKVIQESKDMITLSHLTITRVNNDLFQLSCDVGIITVKK